MDGTIIQQGSFVSTGIPVTLQIRSGIDWMNIYNYTQMAAQNNATGYQFYWQRGFAVNDGVVYYHPAGNHTSAITTSATGIGAGAVGGFTLVDSSLQSPGPAVALTAITAANPPVVTTASTALLSTGNVVRIINTTNMAQIGGMDFSINVINGTTFGLTNMFLNGVTAGTNGFYRVIKFDPIFYPRRRSITRITQAASAVITTSVDHGYTVGQDIRFSVPAAFGMTQMDGLTGSITAVTNATFTVNIDSTGFTAFVFPLNAAVPFTPAQAVPFGEAADTSIVDPNLLGDATLNTGYLGMLLAAGATSPAGQNADVIYWTAGKSFNT